VHSITALGFEPVGYVNVGSITTNTGSFMALFSNSRTLEWADVSVVKSATKMAGYIEFITRCSNDAQVDTKFQAAESIVVQAIRSFMCAPLWNQNEVIGVLYVDTPRSQRFSTADLDRWGRGRSAEDLVRESFQFLLEREPKESILREFTLSVITRYFPDYEKAITRGRP